MKVYLSVCAFWAELSNVHLISNYFILNTVLIQFNFFYILELIANIVVKQLGNNNLCSQQVTDTLGEEQAGQKRQFNM